MTPSTSRRSAPKRPAAPRPPPTAAIGPIALAGGGRPHPPIGLGLWGLGRWTPEAEAHTKAAIGRGIERGVRWFDTAEVYGGGRSERLLGEALHRAGPSAEDAFVVTKVSWEHLRPTQIRAAIVNSLERLARRSVDLYLVHAPDSRVPLAETMPAMEALWKEKKVGAIGVSNFGVAELEEAARHLAEVPIAVNQVRYNLLDREEADPIRDYCRAHGILLEAYSPLAHGLLHGRYLGKERPTADVKRMFERADRPEHWSEILARATALRDLAAEVELPLGAIALHWLRRQGAAPLFGASGPQQVDANLAAWAVVPPDDVLDRADAIARGDRA